MTDHHDWTRGEDGRSNSSAEYLRLVEEVGRLIANVRVGEDPRQVARLILSRLAHVHGLAPAAVHAREE